MEANFGSRRIKDSQDALEPVHNCGVVCVETSFELVLKQRKSLSQIHAHPFTDHASISVMGNHQNDTDCPLAFIVCRNENSAIARTGKSEWVNGLRNGSGFKQFRNEIVLLLFARKKNFCFSHSGKSTKQHR